MSKSPIRKDKTCLNCNYVVENRFCPNCGQENTDTRKTFYHLFVHFFEDLTHYENAFWKTIRNLLLKPSALTKEYLSGKRLSYLAPVRLYIFISFVTFFLVTVFPNEEESLTKVNQTQVVYEYDDNGKPTDTIITQKQIKVSDLMKTNKDEKKLSNAEQNKNMFRLGYDSVAEIDSVQKFGKPDEKMADWEYNLIRKSLVVKAKYNKEELWEKFGEAMWHNLPKALFLYMPMFAFILWLFHGKKRWYYFDHGIFTLHYFSFLLLCSLLLFFFNKILSWIPDNGFKTAIRAVGYIVSYVWMFYYFFPAHHRFYKESRGISFLKSIAMFFINMILIGLVFAGLFVYTFINIH